jgi:hypothetical protein
MPCDNFMIVDRNITVVVVFVLATQSPWLRPCGGMRGLVSRLLTLVMEKRRTK